MNLSKGILANSEELGLGLIGGGSCCVPVLGDNDPNLCSSGGRSRQVT